MADRKLKILISNDDGIEAPGIIRLARAAAKLGEVTVVAPAGQCSGMSQKLTLFTPMEVCQKDDFPVEGVRAWSVDGTPADCIKLALLVLMDEKPDVVFSGINCGYNTGFDIAYSGTVGACLEALQNGIPAVAFSCQHDGGYEVVDEYIIALAQEALSSGCDRSEFININFPGCTLSEFKGILRDRSIARMQLFTDGIHRRETESGGTAYVQWGDPVGPDAAPEGTDIHAVLHNYISVSKVKSALLI